METCSPKRESAGYVSISKIDGGHQTESNLPIIIIIIQKSLKNITNTKVYKFSTYKQTAIFWDFTNCVPWNTGNKSSKKKKDLRNMFVVTNFSGIHNTC